MLSVRVIRRRGALPRAAVSAVEITLVLVLAHAWAGGHLPGAGWIAVMAASVFAAGMVVHRGRMPIRVMAPVLVGVQVLLHAWMALLTAGPSLADDAGMHGTAFSGWHQHEVLEPRMLAVHAAGGVVTALVWSLRDRAMDVVVTWSRPILLEVPRWGAELTATTDAGPRPAVPETAFARRGPPLLSASR
ncbi:hypothetical protein [Nocardioides sp. R-C-SC26]|uniref:hypothetical protein n=1 Tax=Nocardioides sp. R-C-SC26 TaxID=2870414 RepID=UPI001E3E86B5|nr:hypothetical protein [Nocardioides sp. R-C-SC26]